MPRPIIIYVRAVEAVNRVVGRIIMYMIFVMIGILLWSSVSRGFFGVSYIWVVEMSQFLLAGYYLLGGGYSMQLNAHVRMDLLYGRWSERGQAFADSLTAFFVVFYLVFLLLGGISSTEYAITYGQTNYSAWAPPLAPIKIVMTIGILLMLLQSIAIFVKDLAKWRGEPLA
jgi:TRAP-type mannitol/chloroaromatic compound transport system permease small subunit